MTGWIVFWFMFLAMSDLSIGHDITFQLRRKRMRKHLRLMVLVVLLAFALPSLLIFASGYCDMCGYDYGGSTCNTICGGAGFSSSTSSTDSNRPDPPTLQEWVMGGVTDVVPYGSTIVNIITLISSSEPTYEGGYMGAPYPPYETDMYGNKIWH